VIVLRTACRHCSHKTAWDDKTLTIVSLSRIQRVFIR
jgi:hypothetical protein